MPLAVQALLPFVALMAAAMAVRMRPGKEKGWIASGATLLAGLIALIQLLRLAPGEHVDVPYLTTFPFGDLAIRLDGLSLAFSTVTLMTAGLLMLARLQVKEDRRDPWLTWLLTSAAVAAVILAANLVLVYVALQLLTLAWSGAIDETAPRRRSLRLILQVADIGLLLAAASAIQSVGTSAFSGVPSDTFGLATFLLVLAPVVVRIVALLSVFRGPQPPVAFEPAIAWIAPAGYLLLRLLALTGGRLPDRTTAVLLFALGALGAAGLTALAGWGRLGIRFAGLLLAAQGGLGVAFSAGDAPLFTIATTWLWLGLIPLAGLASVRTTARSVSEALTLVSLSMVPGSVGFTGLWIGGLALSARGLLFGAVPVGLAVIFAAVAALGRAAPTRRLTLDPLACWAAGLLVIAAFPIIAINPVILPAVGAVRLVPPGTISGGPLGLTSANARWPALAVSVVLATILVMLRWQFARRLPLRKPPKTSPVRAWSLTVRLRVPTIARRGEFLLWGVLLVVAGIAVTRP